jgi:hypothetical protein
VEEALAEQIVALCKSAAAQAEAGEDYIHTLQAKLWCWAMRYFKIIRL